MIISLLNVCTVVFNTVMGYWQGRSLLPLILIINVDVQASVTRCPTQPQNIPHTTLSTDKMADFIAQKQENNVRQVIYSPLIKPEAMVVLKIQLRTIAQTIVFRVPVVMILKGFLPCQVLNVRLHLLNRSLLIYLV